MKKIALLFLGLTVSGMASAIQMTSPSGTVRMADCALLNEDVSITLSNGVEGGVSCNDASNIMGLATCHTAGRTADRSQEETTCTDPQDPATCTTEVKLVSGAAMPTASTALGTVSTKFPGVDCNAANAETQANTAAGL